MGKNYYTELLENVEALITQEEFDKAKELILEEFKMPYIPLDVEEQLQRYLQTISAEEKEVSPVSYREEDLLRMLSGVEEAQLMAISYLGSCNIRNYMEPLKDYLVEEHSRLLKSFVITLMIDQQISEEIEMRADGITYTFCPVQIAPPFLTDGYEAAYDIIRNTLERDNPSSAKIAFALLLEKCYRALPLSYEEEEGEALAYACIKEALMSLGADDLWEAYKEAYGVEEKFIFDNNI